MTWLDGATVHDLSGSKGNGPFGNNGSFLGVILHVNEDENGTSDSFFEAGPPTNPADVCPNFQVYKDGSIHQYLPLDWQPWCQIVGNFRYAAIETAGLHSEPLTAAQCASIAKILVAYKNHLGMQLLVANSPGEPGLGTHQMGGSDWGGHACPGVIRQGQRQHILDLAAGKKDGVEEMSAADVTKLLTAVAALTDDVSALKTQIANIPDGVWTRQATFNGGKLGPKTMGGWVSDIEQRVTALAAAPPAAAAEATAVVSEMASRLGKA